MGVLGPRFLQQCGSANSFFSLDVKLSGYQNAPRSAPISYAILSSHFQVVASSPLLCVIVVLCESFLVIGIASLS